ncbi:SRPBCC family protein [uncultured Phenylobacterium sp.]|uniref:SRPBCC family protein n=1 Tax=uncultured Phenylobacterium sp. TaxID=349273 RepID=UPI0025FF18D0|nr:SRPBCC family protein [uncultured Phenylobacterium sp.]
MSDVTPTEPLAASFAGDLACFPHHRDATALVPAPARWVFERLDDQTRLAEHMGRPSAMMGGGRMTYEFDGLRGQAVGSHIRMGGEAFGLRLFVDEVVTVRDPSRRKVWRTTGEPTLIIMGAYEMGFEIAEEGTNSRLRVWIDYALPAGGWARRVPGLAALYARWCVRRMVSDAVHHFTAAGARAA